MSSYENPKINTYLLPQQVVVSSENIPSKPQQVVVSHQPSLEVVDNDDDFLKQSNDASSLPNYVQLATSGIKQSNLTKISDPTLLCNRTGVPGIIFDMYSKYIYPEVSCPGYLDLLNWLDYKRSSGMGFILNWLVVECLKCGRNYYFPNAIVGPYNSYKKWKIIRSAASRITNKLLGVKELSHVVEIVTTFPIETRAYDLAARLTKINKCVVKFEEYMNKSYAFGGRLGFSSNIHLWSSSKPLEEHDHVHFIMPCIKKTKLGLRRTPYFIDNIFLDLLKSEWAKIVNKEFNTSYEKLDLYWYYIFIRDSLGTRKLLHKIKYVKRSPIVDLCAWFETHSFDEKGLNKDKIRALINYKNHTRVSGLWKSLSFYSSTSKANQNSHLCNFCGSPTKVLQEVSCLPDKYEVFYIGKKGKVYRSDSL